MKSVCIHAHFYQPSRENPWTQRWEAQASAAPYSSWNERITDECYAPNAAARLLDESGHTRGFRNNYVDISFDVGPTLLHWLEVNRPSVYAAILDADAQSCAKRNGAGAAVAQSYHHAILPLCDVRDRQVEIAWGLADFQRRFGRKARGMWMPETAVCIETLEEMATQGVEFTIVAPHQVATIRENPASPWLTPDAAPGFSERPYWVQLPSGKKMVLFVYDAPLARGVAFDGWLHNGDAFAERLKDSARLDNGVIHLATDGESYGHHHRQGEMALARALEIIDETPDFVLNTYEAILDVHPPTWQATINEYSAWSCAHGVERWRSDCGCCMNDNFHQRWRDPFRRALNDLRVFARAATESLYDELFVEPSVARLAYGEIIGERRPAVRQQWFQCHLRTGANVKNAERLLRLETHLLAMYTSCAWFFDDISGIEARQNLRHAACAVGLLKHLTGLDFRQALADRISVIPTNVDPKPLLEDVHRWLFEQNVEDQTLPPTHLRRRAGTVLHLSALPGDGPIGDLSAVTKVADWMAEAGLEVWQILPSSPCGYGNSPYSSWSTLSGNPWFIDLHDLKEAGLLTDIHQPSGADSVCFETVESWKMSLLESAALRFLASETHPWQAAYASFQSQADWVKSAATFWALKRHFNGQPWWAWPADIRDRKPKAIERVERELATDIALWTVLEFFVDRQWRQARAYLAARGINLLGDIPIYVGEDSCDVWANRSLFQLDEAGRPTHVAGCPPDAYSDDGQRWGNPLYDWDAMDDSGFAWWIRRIERALELTDTVRIDHFLGIVRYWSIPASCETAAGGQWCKGPGSALFDALAAHFGQLPLVVEDLGTLDQATRDLQETLGFPGMRVLQFAFGSGPENEHLPANHPRASISYSSTHDSDTVMGWWSSIPSAIQTEVSMHFQDEALPLHQQLIDVALNSSAIWGVVPIQDWLGLGTEARFNVPGTSTGNWSWRLASGQLESIEPSIVKARLAKANRLPFRFQSTKHTNGVFS